MIILYLILRAMVRITLRIFYKEFSVNGRERLPRSGPLIVLANHPNTLMDPLIVGSLLHQQVGFLGNGSLFRNKFMARFLSFFHVIPVYRKQDIRPGEQIDNEDSFEHARNYLGKKGTLLIFPEGTSYSEKKLRELRTGAARIALSFEHSKDFQGGLQLVPVALNYSAPTRFRTRIRVDVGHPIPIAQFKESYHQDPTTAMRAITEELRQQIESRMVVVDDQEQEVLLSQVHRLYRERLTEEDIPAKGHPALLVEMELAQRIRRLRQDAPEVYARLRDRLGKWFDLLDRLQIQEGFFRERFQRWHPRLLWTTYLLFLVTGFPLYLAGLVTNWLPYWFPSWVAPRVSDEIEYHAPTMMVIGMFLFPLWYAVLLLVAWLTVLPNGWWLLGMAVALPALGVFAYSYDKVARRFAGITALLNIRGRRSSILQALEVQREGLLGELEAALGN